MNYTTCATNLFIVLTGALFGLACIVIIVFEIAAKLIFFLGTFLLGIAVVGAGYLRQKLTYA